MTGHLQVEMARLRSHEIHMRYIYGIRLVGLFISALTILIGAVMVFFGLEGSFNWAVEAPATIAAKITNASPGIIFATVGLFIAIIVVIQRPVNYSTRDSGPSDELDEDDPRGLRIDHGPGIVRVRRRRQDIRKN